MALDYFVNHDQSGKLIGHYSEFTAHTEFTNFWTLGFNSTLMMPIYDDLELRGSPWQPGSKQYMKRPRSPSVWVFFDTVANWNYRDLKSYVNDDTLAPGAVSMGPTTFSDRLWNLNLITRWEFRPGSTAYLVYTHGV